MNSRNDNYLISYYSLRRLIGILGILLPFLCWGVNAFVNHLNLLNNPSFVDESQTLVYTAGADLKSSVSDFYYSTAGPLFTGIMITVAIFLFCYVGYKKDVAEDRFAWLTDRLVATIAACCALGIVVFPTDSGQKITDNIHIFVSSSMIGTIHLIFSALFFLSMAMMSIINFRRHPGKVLITNARGKLFLICGWGIIACLLMLALYFYIPRNSSWLWGRFVYIMEVFMLLFFGIAWLAKGRSMPTEFLLKNFESELESIDVQ